MALQEATGYPAGELQKYEAMGDHEAAECGDLLAVFVSAGKWRDNRTLRTGADHPTGGSDDE
jgi:hypothetical protein